MTYTLKDFQRALVILRNDWKQTTPDGYAPKMIGGRARYNKLARLILADCMDARKAEVAK